MNNKDCLFCKIVAGEEPAEKVWENYEFLCIKNKYPVSKIHVLVMPKAHIRKPEVATSESGVFWGKIMESVFAVVTSLGLDKSGYKIVNNGAGYNHFEHEHVHIMGGSKEEPGGKS